MIQNGQRVRDTISGFDGIVTGRTEYLNGCVQVYVEPDRLDKDGKRIKGVWFDESQVEPVAARTARTTSTRALAAADPPGGPRPTEAPAQREAPAP